MYTCLSPYPGIRNRSVHKCDRLEGIDELPLGSTPRTTEEDPLLPKSIVVRLLIRFWPFPEMSPKCPCPRSRGYFGESVSPARKELFLCCQM